MCALKSLHGKVVLVTGATGFIGTHLVNRLREDGAIPLVLLSRKPRKNDLEGVTSVVSTLEQLSKETWQAAGLERIDVVFHLGSFTPKTNAAADSLEAVCRDNLLGTHSLLESLPSPPERLLFASTIDVYNPSLEDAVLNESSRVNPTSLYGASKVFCEELVRTYAHKHGCGYAILRYGHIFGPGEEAYGKLIPQTIRQLIRGQSPVLYGDGSAARDFLNVADAVEATLQAAISKAPTLDPINIVRGESNPIREIVEMLARITKFEGTLHYLTDKTAGHSLRFDNRRMRESLGDWPFVSLEEGLKQEVRYFQDLANE